MKKNYLLRVALCVMLSLVGCMATAQSFSLIDQFPRHLRFATDADHYQLTKITDNPTILVLGDQLKVDVANYPNAVVELLLGEFDLKGKEQSLRFRCSLITEVTVFESTDKINFTPVTLTKLLGSLLYQVVLSPQTKYVRIRLKGLPRNAYIDQVKIGLQNSTEMLRPSIDTAYAHWMNKSSNGDSILSSYGNANSIRPKAGFSTFSNEIIYGELDLRDKASPHLFERKSNFDTATTRIFFSDDGILYQQQAYATSWGDYWIFPLSKNTQRIKFVNTDAVGFTFGIYDNHSIKDLPALVGQGYPFPLNTRYLIDSVKVDIPQGKGEVHLVWGDTIGNFILKTPLHDSTRYVFTFPIHLPATSSLGSTLGFFALPFNEAEYSFDGIRFHPAQYLYENTSAGRFIGINQSFVLPRNVRYVRLSITVKTNYLVSNLYSSGPLLVNAGSPIKLGGKDAFYDFDSIGGFAYIFSDAIRSNDTKSNALYKTSTLEHNFGLQPLISTTLNNWYAYTFDMERLHPQGGIDLSTQLLLYDSYNRPSMTSYMYKSQADGSYTFLDNGRIIPQLDLNHDGRLDYLYGAGKIINTENTNQGLIAYQQAGGGFSDAHIKTMTFDEYDQNQVFDEDEWVTAAVRPVGGKVIPYHTVLPPAGGCLAKSPRQREISPESKALSMVQMPSRFADLNKDGIPDMLSPSNGTLYYGGGNNTYITTALDGNVLVKDFNNDGISDYIVYGGKDKKITAFIYAGEGKFTEQLLYQNLTMDQSIHCYDFDKDGDVDVLITFSTYLNATKANYTLLCKNDGMGNFTLSAKTTSDDWKFSTCVDLDNDGLMELLHIRFRDTTAAKKGSLGIADIQYRKIKSDFSFGDTVTLFPLPFSLDLYSAATKAKAYEAWNIHVADIDRDGHHEVWLQSNFSTMVNAPNYSSGYAIISSGGYIHRFNNLTPNTRPQKPLSPQLSYDAGSGRLDIQWEQGRDTENSAVDLTYALRVGSAPGKDDIYYAHAFADGSRRNLKNGNMGYELSHYFDCKSWKPGRYYVSIQTVDALHLGSEFSEPATFVHSYLPSTFSLSKINQGSVTCFDTVELFYSQYPDLDYQWELGDAKKLDSANGYFLLQWPTAGKKTLQLSVSQGDSLFSDTYPTDVWVLPNKIIAFDSIGIRNPSGYSMKYSSVLDKLLADYNFDGHLDAVKEGTSGTSNGLFLNQGNGIQNQDQELYNTSLNPSKAQWLDLTNNGRIDLFFVQGSNYNYLKHSSTEKGNFGLFAESLADCKFMDGASQKTWATAITGSWFLKDMNNDGLWDVVLCNSSSINIYFQEDQRTFRRSTHAITNGNHYRWVDLNRDGLLDYAYMQSVYSGGKNYYSIRFLENTGKKAEPFKAHSLKSSNIGSTDKWSLHDMNADGYLDLVRSSGKKLLIDWNLNNANFGDSLVLTVDQNLGILADDSPFNAMDLDNNGYLDLLLNVTDKRDNVSKAYVFYFDAQGLMAQGFLSDVAFNYTNSYLADVDGDKIPDLLLNTSKNHQKMLSASGQNTAPQAPTHVVAQQGEDGLWIEWDPAQDQETPYALMRYNLSVKKKGATGDKSYIYSPLNGGENGMAAMPRYYSANGSLDMLEEVRNHAYLRSTKILIPSTGLSGELEIRVQAIDAWDVSSAFSEPIFLKVKDAVDLVMPSQSCFNEPIEISFLGTKTGSPTWNFDGGTVVSGSAWGPYFVKWNSPGVKIVQVSNSGDTAEAQTLVHEQLTGFDMPFTNVYTSPLISMTRTSEVWDEQIYNFSMPHVLPRENYFSWNVLIKASQLYQFTRKNLAINTSPGNTKGSVWFEDRQFYDSIKLVMTVHLNSDACRTSYEKVVKLMPPLQTPQITYLSQNNGKLWVNWDTNFVDKNIDEIIIYKEGSYFNSFSEIARVPRTDAYYIDESSNVNIRSEAYQIMGRVSTLDMSSKRSDLHQSIRLNITKGDQGKLTLVWSPYIGCKIEQFRVLRGSSPSTMQVIATLDGKRVFYLDANPKDDELYYSLEYTPIPNEQYANPKERAAKNGAKIQSNTVFAGNASQVVKVSKLNILALQKTVELNEQQQNLHLYAEIFPSNATYQNVVWSIAAGSEKATINSAGVLSGKPQQTGTVKVRVSSTDGSEIYGERSIAITAFSLPCQEPYQLFVSQTNDSAASFTWNGSSSEYMLSYFDTLRPLNLSSKTVTTNYVNLIHSDFPQGGVYKWTLKGKCGSDFSTAVNGEIFVIKKATTPPPGPTQFPVSITLPVNGTISVHKGSTAISSGALLDSASVLTLVATPNSGYRFGGWWDLVTDSLRSFVLHDNLYVSANFVIITPTGIGEEKNEAKEITVYPNPVRDLLYIKTTEAIKQVVVLDIKGNTLILQNDGRSSVNMQHLPTDSYIVRIHTERRIVSLLVIKI